MRYDADLNFLFNYTTRVVFGPRSVREASMEMDRLGTSRALLVTDKVLHDKTDVVEKTKKALGKRLAGVFDDVPPDSSVAKVDQGAAMARELGADVIVSVGGGSVLDTAKGITIVTKLGGSLKDYEGFQILDGKVTPHIAIPTTAGTGSEVTYVAVIKDHEQKRKMLFGDHYIIPDTAILDPDLIQGLPPHLTAATGMDAFSHALESLHSSVGQPVSDGLALHAAKLIDTWLERSVQDGSDLMARGQLLIASNLAGAAFSNAQVGLCHAIAHTIGARHGVHHGLANAIAMPHVIRYNGDETAEAYRELARALSIEGAEGSDEEMVEALASHVAGLIERTGLTTRFRDAGVPEDDLVTIAELTLEDGAIVYNGKPCFDADEILDVIKAAW